MNKKTTLFFLMLIFCGIVLQGQNLSKQGVLKMNIRSAGPIIQNGIVKGYYMFYRLDKQDSKNYNYQLSVYDENLREINSTTIVRPKSFVMVEGAFNSEAFGFLFYDSKLKSVELIAYDKTLKATGSVKKKVSNKFAIASFKNIALGQDPSQAFLVPIDGKGFVYYGLKAGSKIHYETEFFDNNMKSVWVQRAGDKTKKSVESAAEAFHNDKYIGSLITLKALNSSNTDTDLMVNETATGKQLFRVPLVTEKYSVSFSEVYFDEVKETITIFGEYFSKTARELSSRSLGFITLVYDITGNLKESKVNSWEHDISKAAPVNHKGKFDGNNTSILFHNIIRTSDGKIFVIGEQYKKAASAGGIIVNVMFGAGVTSNVQLNVYNIVVFEFNPDYSIHKVHVFEKDKNVLQLPAGYGNLSPRSLSYFAKAVGGFDYLFTQNAEDGSMFSVSYLNYDKEQGQKAKNVLGTIVYTPEKVFTVDKQTLNRKSTVYYVYKAKEGYVLISEYFKKEKKVESRLEKVNY